MKPIVTQDDKKLVGHLKKKSKKVHVYFNRKKSNKGDSTYLTGKYYSEKNKKEFTYRSSYELRFYHLLDMDPRVETYDVEGVKVPYIDVDGTKRNYIPDVIVMYKTGRLEVCEVKPQVMLENETVQLKAAACKIYFKELLKSSGVPFSFKFITEKDLFSSNTEYSLFLKNNV